MISESPVGRLRPVESSSCSAPRIRRRIRFRVTAVPTFRVMTNATRVVSSSSDSRWRMLKYSERTNTPWVRSRANVARSEIPRIKQRASVDPSGDGCLGPRGRRESTSDCETRASWHAFGRWVGTYASWFSSFLSTGNKRCTPGVNPGCRDGGRTRELPARSTHHATPSWRVKPTGARVDSLQKPREAPAVAVYISTLAVKPVSTTDLSTSIFRQKDVFCACWLV